MVQVQLVEFAEFADYLMRLLAWVTLAGMITVGLCFGGGLGLIAWHSAHRMASPRRRAGDGVAREAARGICEIEAYLHSIRPSGDPR